MNGALFELLGRSLRGALVRRARRLRQPRYLLAFLASAAYFGFLVLPSFLRWSRHGSANGPGAFGPGARFGPFGPAADPTAGLSPGLSVPLPGGGTATLAEVTHLLTLAVALVLAAGLTLLWIFASSKPALRLSEADVDLLLPAPLHRRQIIELALWKQQAGLLFGALVVSFVRGYGSPATRFARFFGVWALFTTLSLHAKGVSLWKARLRELPLPVARRRIAAAVALAAAFWLSVTYELRAVASATGGWTNPAPALHRLATAPPPFLAVLVTPLRWLAAGALVGFGRFGGGELTAVASAGGGAGAGFHALAGGLLLAVLLVAHYEWVVRSRARFEDSALDNARRQATRRQRRPGLPTPSTRARRLAPFQLQPDGWPEAAIYWKNLLLASRTPLSRRALRVLLPGLATWGLGAALRAPLPFVLPAVMTGIMLMLMVPLFSGLNLRHDLRTDLLQLDVLRCWPLPGWRLVAAELLAPVTTAFGWSLAGFGVLLGAMLAAGGDFPGLSQAAQAVQTARAAHAAAGSLHALTALSALPTLSALAETARSQGLVLALALGGALVIAGVPVALLSSGLQNLAALLLPGWLALGMERRAGSSLAGQRLLMLVAHFVGLLVGLLPAVLAVGATLLAAGALGLSLALWQAPLLALVGGLPILAEVGLLVRLGGALWDRLDPAQEMLNPET